MIHVKTKAGLTKRIPSRFLKDAAHQSLEHQGIPAPYALTILLTEDSQLHSLNREYLGVDAPTDVLSFPSDELIPESGEKYLGDIVISVPRAESQAKAAGHSLKSEAQLLVVHGTLHLLGYDHSHASDKARMWKAQGEILERLGLGNIQVREE